MARADILAAYYTLVSQLTVVNGFNYDWASIKSIDNGALTPTSSPVLSFAFGEESNDNESNGIGNNKLQCEVPMRVTAVKKLVGVDQTLDVVEYNIEIQRSAMLDDIKRAFANPYKIACTTGFLNIKYTGEVEADEEDLDQFTVYSISEFLVTYRQELEINEW